MKKTLSLILIFVMSIVLFGVTVTTDEGEENYSFEGDGVLYGIENSAPPQTYSGNFATNSVGNYSDILYSGVFLSNGIEDDKNSNDGEITLETNSLYDADVKWIERSRYEIQIP